MVSSAWNGRQRQRASRAAGAPPQRGNVGDGGSGSGSGCWLAALLAASGAAPDLPSL